MIVLKIKEEKREELTAKCIVICAYTDINGNYLEGIDIMYKDQYPDFEEVEVVIDPII